MHAVQDEVLGQEPLEIATKLPVQIHLDHLDVSSLARPGPEVGERPPRHRNSAARGTELRASGTFAVEVQVRHARADLLSRHLWKPRLCNCIHVDNTLA